MYGTPSQSRSQSDETKEKKRKAVRDSRARTKERDQKLKNDIEEERRENRRLETEVAAISAQMGTLQDICSALDWSSGGEFGKTPEGAEIFKNLNTTVNHK